MPHVLFSLGIATPPSSPTPLQSPEAQRVRDLSCSTESLSLDIIKLSCWLLPVSQGRPIWLHASLLGMTPAAEGARAQLAAGPSANPATTPTLVHSGYCTVHITAVPNLAIINSLIQPAPSPTNVRSRPNIPTGRAITARGTGS